MVGYQGPLQDLGAFEILSTRGLPAGRRSLYFGVDTRPDGILNLNRLEYAQIVIDVR